MKIKQRLGKDIVSVIIASVYLIVYLIFLHFNHTLILAMLMLLFSPVMFVLMVYSILKYGKCKGPDLGNDEYGYQDRNKDVVVSPAQINSSVLGYEDV